MILIFSEPLEFSTDKVCEWLEYYDKKYVRCDTLVEHIGHESKKGFYFVQDKKYYFKEISSSWYRRGGNIFRKGIKIDNASLENLYYSENLKLSQYLYYLIGKKKRLNRVFDGDKVNRLIVLDKAKELGLLIPEMVFAENRNQLNEIEIPLITKTITGSAMLVDDFGVGVIYTNKITDEIPDFSQVSYFENEIEKKYELRIFFLNDELYSMAIFSQKDNQTKGDFRRYNKTTPNRNVPFQLPKTIESKLIKLMKELNLNSGSIDMIVSKNNEYIFLEVNPIGQFGMVSFPCNYYLEKRIATYL